MTIAAITFLPALSLPMPPADQGAAAAPSSQFANLFTQQISQLNDQLVGADLDVQRLAAGDAGNLHQVMINLEQAKLSMQLVIQVRNHLLDAYHELMQMQM